MNNLLWFGFGSYCVIGLIVGMFAFAHHATSERGKVDHFKLGLLFVLCGPIIWICCFSFWAMEKLFNWLDTPTKYDGFGGGR